MTGLLSAISGQFTKSLILGALFPAAVFVLLWLVFVAPLLPPGFILSAPPALEADWSVLSITFVTLVLTGLLYNLDTPIIKLYEGYPWKDSWLGRKLCEVQRARRNTLVQRKDVLFELTDNKSVVEYERLERERSEIRLELPRSFPDRPDLVLPTRLGNIIRAFERYPSIQYGVEAITVWPRLVAVIPPGYSSALADARTTLTFLLNLSLLSALLAVATMAAGLADLPPSPFTRVLLPALCFSGASVWLYRQSFGAAHAWGAQVRGAFDLYRWELLKQMGYRQQPRTREEERKLWKQLTWQIIFGDREIEGGKLRSRVDYADPPPLTTVVAATPRDIGLETTRALAQAGRGGDRRVVVAVANVDAQRRMATAVTVTETFPHGTMYGWNSARADNRAVRVVGTGPYTFHLGNVRAGATVVLTYVVYPTDSEPRE